MKTTIEVANRLNRLNKLKKALTETIFVEIMVEEVSPLAESVFQGSHQLKRIYGLLKAEQKVEHLLNQSILVLQEQYPIIFETIIEPPYSELLLEVLEEENFDVLDNGDNYLVRYRIPYGQGSYVMKFEMSKEDEKMKDDFLRETYFRHIRRTPVSVPENVHLNYVNGMRRVSKETIQRFNVIRNRVKR